MSRLKLLAATAAVTALVAPGAAYAGPPGKWTKVTAPNINIDEAGVARTPDGVLHVLWARENAGLGGTVLHSSVSANAKTISGPDTVFGYAGGVNRGVQLLAVPGGGLRAFFAGLSEDSPLDSQLATATSVDGKAWSVQPTAASHQTPASGSAVYSADGIGGAIGAGGVPISTWGDSAPGQGGYHVGLDAAAADERFGGACCVYNPNVGVDAISGQAVVAWKFITDSSGTAAKAISPAGPQVTLPGAAAAGTGSRTGITGRIGAPGIYVAYQQGSNQFLSRPALWRFGTTKAKLLSKQRGAESVGIAPGPNGRLWVFWERQDRIYATRSNKAATVFGATVDVAPPKGSSDVTNVAGEGSRGPLDVLALVNAGGYSNWHQRLLPGLTLKAKPQQGAVRFTVRDAGDAVGGVRVKVGGKSAKTAVDGTVTIALKAGGYRAKASKKGYTATSTRTRAR
jgi:hypothetical protein